MSKTTKKTTARRHRNAGLRKICTCKRSAWPKCAHAWHFAFKWQGTHHRLSLAREFPTRTIDSRTAAEAAADELRTAIRAGTFRQPLPARDTLTLAQLFDTFTRDVLAVRPGGTRANDRHAVASITSAPLRRLTGDVVPFGAWLVADITSATLEQFRTVRSVRTLTGRTGRGGRTVGGPRGVNRLLAFVRRVFNWAIAAGHLDATPFKRHGQVIVKLTKEPKRSRRLEDGEAERLLAACGDHLRAVVECALETGMRRGEILSLQWRDVALEAGEIRLRGANTKTASGRTVPISTRLRAILTMRRNGPDDEPHPGTDYVFGTEIGTKVGDVGTAWLTACRKATITDLHLHDLRREAGSRWLDGGVPIHTVRDWLGHTNVSQTSTYLAGTAKTSHDAMRRFEARRGILQDLATDGGTRHHERPRTDTTSNENTPENTIKHHAH